MTIYATYFDSNFLHRGLACLESLVAQSPANPQILVLALDAACATALEQLWPQIGRGSKLEIVTLDALERAHDALAVAKATRPLFEYYFTLTPFLCAEALARAGRDEYAIYIDADLFFFTDPEIALRAAAGADIGLVEHRFPQSDAEFAELYGRFNVGWIAFRSAPETDACIARWRQECLASCACEPTGGIFGDQKYLDIWPAQVTSLKVIEHPGVNLARWNLKRHRLALAESGAIKIDGDDLVFFHFSQLIHRGASLYEVYVDEYGAVGSLICSEIYAPYLLALDRIETLISAEFEWRAVGTLLPQPSDTMDRWQIFWPPRVLRTLRRHRTIFQHGRLLSPWRSLLRLGLALMAQQLGAAWPPVLANRLRTSRRSSSPAQKPRYRRA